MLSSRDRVFFPELSKLPSIGAKIPDIETILELEPDVVITWSTDMKNFDEKLQASISVIVLDLTKPQPMLEEIIKLGYILGKTDEAKRYVEFRSKYFSLIGERIKGLSEEEKPKVYIEYLSTYMALSSQSYVQLLPGIAGGRNIYGDLPGAGFRVDPEDLIIKNPDIIIRYIRGGKTGYGVKDPSELVELREEIMNRPELAEVNAVKSGKVYIVHLYISTSYHLPVGLAYFAKVFHPDLVKDLDPIEIHQEFIDKFCPGLDYNIKEQRGFIYPPLE